MKKGTSDCTPLVVTRIHPFRTLFKTLSTLGHGAKLPPFPSEHTVFWGCVVGGSLGLPKYAAEFFTFLGRRMSTQMGLLVGYTALSVGFLFGDILTMMMGAVVIVMERTRIDD